MYYSQLRVPDWLRQAATVGLDIETTGLDPYGGVVTAIAISDGASAAVFDIRGLDPREVAGWLDGDVFNNKRVIIHNGLFDLTWLRHHFRCGYPAKLFDTMLAETLLTAGLYETEEDDDGEERRIKASRSLQASAARRLGVHLTKDHDIRTGFTQDSVWSPEMIAYAAADARTLIPLFKAQSKALVAEQIVAVARIEMAVLPVFVEMGLRGVAIDADGMQPLLALTRKEADAQREHLEGVLTRHVLWARKRRNAEIEQRFTDWRQRQDFERQGFEAEWWRVKGLPEPSAEFERLWLSYHVEGSAHPEITREEIATWLDEAAKDLKKNDPAPRGLGRYVRRMMQVLGTTPAGKRPAGQIVDVTEPINLRSWQQKTAAIVDYLEEYNLAHGTQLLPPANFKKGSLVGWSLDVPADVYETLVKPLLAFAKADKLLSSFGDKLLVMLHPDGTLHGGWRQIGTATGRPACTQPNLLNMPNVPAFRGRFRARDGHLFIVADYSQMELRELAEFSGDPEMQRAFRDGIDLHTLTASALFAVPLEAVSDDQRKRAKVVNFGIAYGMAERGLRRAMMGWGIRVSEAEAADYLRLWREKFAVAWAWIETQGAAGLRSGFTTTPLGRRRYFDTGFAGLDFRERRYRQGKIKREAANHPIQGGNADVTKLAMVLIQQELAPLGGSILMQVYDEIVSEVPAQHAAAAREIVVGGMTAAAGLVLQTVPVAVDAVISPSWSEKEAIREGRAA